MCCHHISHIRFGIGSNSFVAAQSADPAENYLTAESSLLDNVTHLTHLAITPQAREEVGRHVWGLHQTRSRKTGMPRGLFICSISDLLPKMASATVRLYWFHRGAYLPSSTLT